MKKSQFKTLHYLPRLSCSAGTLAASAAALLLLAGSASLRADDPGDNREPDLGTSCATIEAPGETNKVIFHAYAIGTQNYKWNGSAWVFIAPAAVLYANADYDGEVGTHFAGPTWESNSGSKVVGRRVAGCTPDPTAIPWLLLQAVSSSGRGVLHDVTYIQRVNTVGGIAPSAPGSFVGQEADVPYTAEYYFYRAESE